MSRLKAFVSLCLALVYGAASAATSTPRTSKPLQPHPPVQEQQAIRRKLALDIRSLSMMAPSPLDSRPHPTSHFRRRAFQIPLLKGMDLHPGYAVVDRYTPPPPPGLHVRIHCVIANGNVYIDGTVTGNYGRPIPGAVIYQGVGDVVTGKVTSSRSGQLHGTELLTGGHVGLPPGLRRFPMHCVAPNVNVGAPPHVMQSGQGTASVHQ